MVLLLLTSFCGVLGVVLTLHIQKKKAAEKPFVCPLHADCSAVVHSDFSTFLGIPVERLGTIYYGFIMIVYGLYATISLPVSYLFSFTMLATTTLAFLFSLYLTFIQIFTLRQWCSWCLMSASLSTLIFILAIWFVDDLRLIVASYTSFVYAIHLIALVFGVVIATLTDVLSLRFLRDRELSSAETDVLKTMLQLMWLSLGLVVATSLGMLTLSGILDLPIMLAVHHSAIFVAVFVGALFNLRIIPTALNRFQNSGGGNFTSERPTLQSLSVGVGIVSLSAWYTAFLFAVIYYF